MKIDVMELKKDWRGEKHRNHRNGIVGNLRTD